MALLMQEASQRLMVSRMPWPGVFVFERAKLPSLLSVPAMAAHAGHGGCWVSRCLLAHIPRSMASGMSRNETQADPRTRGLTWLSNEKA